MKSDNEGIDGKSDKDGIEGIEIVGKVAETAVTVV